MTVVEQWGFLLKIREKGAPVTKKIVSLFYLTIWLSLYFAFNPQKRQLNFKKRKMQRTEYLRKLSRLNILAVLLSGLFLSGCDLAAQSAECDCPLSTYEYKRALSKDVYVFHYDESGLIDLIVLDVVETERGRINERVTFEFERGEEGRVKTIREQRINDFYIALDRENYGVDPDTFHFEGKLTHANRSVKLNHRELDGFTMRLKSLLLYDDLGRVVTWKERFLVTDDSKDAFKRERTFRYEEGGLIRINDKDSWSGKPVIDKGNEDYIIADSEILSPLNQINENLGCPFFPLLSRFRERDGLFKYIVKKEGKLENNVNANLEIDRCGRLVRKGVYPYENSPDEPAHISTFTYSCAQN